MSVYDGAQLHTFAEWLRLVDRELEAVVGLSHSDLADAPFRDWYGAEMTPREAAEELLEAEGFDVGGGDNGS